MRRYFISEYFKKQAKPYFKKYRHLLDDVIQALKTFEKRSVISLGANTYKIRIKASDIPKGKSHAFRLIILLIEREDELFIPLVLYFKGDRASITKAEILYHSQCIQREIEAIQ
ncbi:hypothetical protein HZA41_02820 [Candidatus Peregrinibacteria bacterium]|nr:hypothetical protein [Candidatus Peregrinibacteria bacterium]